MRKLVKILLCIPVFAVAQSPNYVKTTDYKVPTLNGHTATDGSGAVTAEKKIVNVVYYDGLGRPIQKVGHLQSGDGRNIVLPIVYNASGIPVKNYLSYPSDATTLSYVDNTSIISSLESFYTSQHGSDGQNPYSEVLLEASPFKRLQKQSAPGADWMMPTQTGDIDHTIRFDYEVNEENEVRKYYSIDTTSINAPVLNFGQSYTAGELTKTILKNENWVLNQKDNTTEEFRDKGNRLLLKRTYESGAKHDTYYVYDQYGNLTFVIPPIVNTNGVVSPQELEGYCYHYKYDHRNRLIQKKIPGKDWEYLVYDKLNRVVASGPAHSPFKDIGGLGWLIVKYDVFNRPVITGWMPASTVTSTTRNDLQAENDAHTPMYTSDTKIQNAAIVLVNGIGMRYDNYSWPNSTSRYHILTVNYFDDYNFPDAPEQFESVTGVYYNNSTLKPKGLATGSLVRILTTSSNLDSEKSYVLYDKYGRGIHQHTTNHMGGYLEQDILLDFAGKASSVVSKHKKETNSTLLSVTDRFIYTGQDRLLTHTHQIGSQAAQLLRKNDYNKLGQLIRKAVGGTDVTGTFAFQKVDYRYTIRGWLSEINDASQLQKSGDPNDLFGYKINYNNVEDDIGHTGEKQYNGNISETYWTTATDPTKRRKYSYDYDHLNRLTAAIYIKPGILNPVTNAYNELISYDKNGNIKSLERYGGQDEGIALKIDDLTYNYKDYTNQLINVIDDENNSSGFNDGADEASEYDYDLTNGNMTRDANKGIDTISYNHLNLPVSIEFATGNKIEYIYSAIGTKVSKKVIESGVSSQTDYQGGCQYIAGKLAFFPTAEGYVDATAGAYKYVFQYKDHLGNIRVSYTQQQDGSLKILEDNHYYPYGMKHSGYNAPVFDYLQIGSATQLSNVTRNKNQFKYNGQEFQDELGLNVTAMDYRQYDNALGRFNGVDALAEQSSSITPYHFGNNNPVFWADPSGLSVSLYGNGDSFLINASGADAKNMFKALVNAMDGKTTRFTTEDYKGLSEFAVYHSFEEFESMGGGSTSPNSDFQPSPEFERLSAITFKGHSSTWASQIQQHVYENSSFYDSYSEFDAFGGSVGLTLDLTTTYWNNLSNKGQWKSSYKIHKFFKNNGFKIKTSAIKSSTPKILQSAGRGLGYLAGAVTVGEVLYNSEIKASNILDVTITGVSFIPGVGWIIGGSYFVGDMIHQGVYGYSIGDRLDNSVGGPLYDWEW